MVRDLIRLVLWLFLGYVIYILVFRLGVPMFGSGVGIVLIVMVMIFRGNK
jgi:hypothetical protein